MVSKPDDQFVGKYGEVTDSDYTQSHSRIPIHSFSRKKIPSLFFQGILVRTLVNSNMLTLSMTPAACVL